MMRATDDRSIKLTDPRALKAFAHPVRLALVGLLRREGALTATRAGERLGESSGTCSFHLRQLARYGLVEEAGGGRGREKPWRATALYTTWPEVAPTPELADAAESFERFVAERYYVQLLRWVAAKREQPVEWQQAAVFGDLMLSVTPEELEQLGRDIQALAAPYVERFVRGERSERERLVTFVQLAFPHLGERD